MQATKLQTLLLLFLLIPFAGLVAQGAPAPTSQTAAPSPTSPASAPVAGTALSAAVLPVAYDAEPLPRDPAAALLLASNANGIGSPGLKPWHLKAHYQTYDAHGKAANTGTFELYWVAKDRYRVSYSSSNFTQVLYHADGGIYRVGNPGMVPYAESQIWDQFMHPMQVHDKSPQPVLRDEKREKFTETCLEFQSEQDNTVTNSYCLEPKIPLLRTSYLNGYGRIFNKIRLFQHRFIAGEIGVSDWGFPLVNITLDDLRGLPPTDLPALQLPADAIKIELMEPLDGADSGLAKAAVLAGHAIRKPQPEYPVEARKQRIEGTVRIAATIGKDGFVHDPQVVHDPDGMLSRAALKAVSQWTYSPYLLDGRPVEVHTLMNVFFRMGR